MSDCTIRTNWIPRQLLYGYELSEKERKGFDYVEDIDNAGFVRYRGELYDISEFMWTTNAAPFDAYWHGYAADSFFSGVLIHLCEDSDYVVMGFYCC